MLGRTTPPQLGSPQKLLTYGAQRRVAYVIYVLVLYFFWRAPEVVLLSMVTVIALKDANKIKSHLGLPSYSWRRENCKQNKGSCN